MTDGDKELVAELILSHPGWRVVLDAFKTELRRARAAFFGAQPGTDQFGDRALSLHATTKAFEGALKHLYHEADVDFPNDLKAIFEMNA